LVPNMLYCWTLKHQVHLVPNLIHCTMFTNSTHPEKLKLVTVSGSYAPRDSHGSRLTMRKGTGVEQGGGAPLGGCRQLVQTMLRGEARRVVAPGGDQKEERSARRVGVQAF
jgi:hypothetical protein